MKMRIKLIVLSIFFFLYGLPYLYPQEKLNTKIQTGTQSQGTQSELEKPANLPKATRLEYIDKIMKEEAKNLSPAPAEKAPKPKTASSLAVATEEMPYYLDFGDVLDISVFELPLKKKAATLKGITEREEYYVDSGDVLDISVWQVPDLSRPEVIVRPDGKISFPLIGDIKAEGLTLTQLDSLLTEKLKSYVRNPEVTVMLRHYGGQENKGIGINKITLLNDLSRSEVIVMPDGKIYFPLIGGIKAKGLTLTQLDGLMTNKLRPYVRNPDVTVMIRRFGEQANKVIVLGEILGPGIYRFDSRPTITEAIASAGGYTRYAVLNSVMIIRGDVKAKPEVIRANVAKILLSGRTSENIFLKPNDIVYVPRSFIGKVNVFLEIIQPAISEYMQTLNAKHLHNVVHRKGGV